VGGVVELLEDETLFAEVKCLVKLVEPVCQVVMAVQNNKSTLADVARFWIYVGNELAKLLPTIRDRGKKGTSANAARAWVGVQGHVMAHSTCACL
jgi:hypothetical protein